MSRQSHRHLCAFVYTIAVVTAAAGVARAGNIDPKDQGNQYAWGENVGWINFKPSQGPGVTVTSTSVRGFAWGENIGWIDLNPIDGGGVQNDGIGHLSGFAWAENVGWINFAPNGASVSIGADGRFTGFAWGENIGWINFDVPSGVQTSFKPEKTAPALGPWGMLLIIVSLGILGLYHPRERGRP
jgi:hypothetical protein